MDYKDYYAVLGVPKDATPQTIQKAYRKLARKFHPDVNKEKGAEAKFREVAEAYEVLGDADKRTKYDRYGSAWNAAQQRGGGGRPGQAPPGFEEFVFDFGQGGAGMGGGFGGGTPGGFSSFFEMLFGRSPGAGAPGGFAWSSTPDQPGSDQEAMLELTLDEAARGGEREITLADAAGSPGKTFRVKIPAGIRPGQRIRLPGRGSTGIGSGKPGDLYLKIAVRPDPRFRVEGSDLHATVPITPAQAALGGEVTVATLDGPSTFRVPAGTSSGRRVRLRGKGYPAAGAPGDLYAELRIVVPETLTDRQRELYEQLAKETN